MAITYFLIFLLGSSLASFGCLIAWRLIDGPSLKLARSQCDWCHSKLGWIDLLPTFSFIYLRGRSRCCQQKLSRLYFWLELFGGLSACFLFYYSSTDWAYFSLLSILVFFTVVFTTSDLKAYLLPNPLMAAFFIVNLIYVLVFQTDLLIWRLLALFLISSIMFFLHWLHPRSIGGGDLKLIAVLAFLIGLRLVFLSLFIASSLGLAVFAISKLRKHRLPCLPFGPFLFVATFISLFVDQLFF